jgi:hypothetical protein
VTTRWPLAALAMVALIGAGCSNKPAETGAGTNNTAAATREQAVKFAQCIRDNGVKDFPDPTPDGPLIDTNRIPSVAGKDPRSVLDAPMQKCRDFAAGAGVRGQ